MVSATSVLCKNIKSTHYVASTSLILLNVVHNNKVLITPSDITIYYELRTPLCAFCVFSYHEIINLLSYITKYD